jgi:hypothetical protein
MATAKIQPTPTPSPTPTKLSTPKPTRVPDNTMTQTQATTNVSGIEVGATQKEKQKQPKYKGVIDFLYSGNNTSNQPTSAAQSSKNTQTSNPIDDYVNTLFSNYLTQKTGKNDVSDLLKAITQFEQPADLKVAGTPDSTTELLSNISTFAKGLYNALNPTISPDEMQKLSEIYNKLNQDRLSQREKIADYTFKIRNDITPFVKALEESFNYYISFRQAAEDGKLKINKLIKEIKQENPNSPEIETLNSTKKKRYIDALAYFSKLVDPSLRARPTEELISSLTSTDDIESLLKGLAKFIGVDFSASVKNEKFDKALEETVTLLNKVAKDKILTDYNSYKSLIQPILEQAKNLGVDEKFIKPVDLENKIEKIKDIPRI